MQAFGSKCDDMISTLLQMALIIACGAVWRTLQPAGLNAQQTRLVVTSVVYYFLLPALILEVLWQATLGLESLQYSFLAISSTVFAIVCSWIIGRLMRFQAAQMGTIILAAAFANVTFLGLPVLEQLFGPSSRSVVIQIDLFAISPFLYTFGIALVRHYGSEQQQGSQSVLGFLNAPPFWAALLAVILNLNHVPAPIWLTAVLIKLSAAVVPLMLFSLGLALSWKSIQWQQLSYVLPVVLIKLLIMPGFAFAIVPQLTLTAPNQAVAVIDLAMPSMLMGIVLCDRYRLDSALYAMLVSITTLLSVFTLPFWYRMI